MPLDPVVQAVLEQAAAAGAPPFNTLAPADARNMYIMMNSDVPKADMASVTNQTIEANGQSIPIRIYRPEAETTLPALVFYHGGGWVIGNLDTHDAPCRLLAQQANCVVIAVDYRLAPESIYPAAVDDCLAATRWVFESAASLNIDANNIAVGGDSAGGNLAAVVALKSKQELNIKHQLLIYPVTDGNMNTESYQSNGEGYLLTADTMAWFWDHYADAEARLTPDASPLLRSDLSDLANTSLFTAEFDPLRDEGEAYADALKAVGNQIECKRFDGLIHGFISMTHAVPAAADAFAVISASLTKAFASNSNK